MLHVQEESSESDSDSSEEIQIKRFLNPAFEHQLKQTKYTLAKHGGVKPQKGHYELLKTKKTSSYYDGRHWLVNMQKPLERTVRRLTLSAIDNAVKEEQSRLISQNRRRFQAARPLLSPLLSEFHEIMEVSKKRQIVEDEILKNKTAKIKDDVQSELLTKKHSEIILRNEEIERKNQMSVLKTLSDKSVKRTPSVEEIMTALAETNQKRLLINRDIEEAAARLEESEGTLNEDYEVAMTEMLDESLIKVIYMFDRDRNNAVCVEEQRQRIRESQSPIQDAKKKQSKLMYRNVIGDINKIASDVLTEEDEIKEEYKEKVMEMKTVMQEDLIRCVAKKWADKASALERARRIQEVETLSSSAKQDKFMEVVKAAMSRVQRQMILQKFNGRWVTEKFVPEERIAKAPNMTETEHDRKLRMMRTRCRRQSCVVRGDED